MSDSGGGEIGHRTPLGPGGYEIATQSTGLVVAGLDAVLSGELDNAYALSRPPGHRAEPFYGRSDVLTVSLHQDRNYPWDKGFAEDRGDGDGIGFNLNVPLPPARATTATSKRWNGWHFRRCAGSTPTC